jgi:four helix bundle protein
MAQVKRFEDLEAWQNARSVFQWVLTLKGDLKSHYFLRLFSQIVESTGSVMDNIAEGFERSGNKEFVGFLLIAKGSAGEARSQLYRLFDANFIDEPTFANKKEELEHLSGKISALISYLKKSDKKGWRFQEPTENYE